MTTEYDEAEALAWFVTLCDDLRVPLDSDLDLLCAVYGPLLPALHKPVYGPHLYTQHNGHGHNSSVKLWHQSLPCNWYFDYTGSLEDSRWEK